MSKTLITGIYQIINIKTQDFYIGSAVNLSKRFLHHLGRLHNNSHKNQHLQHAWNKYGEKSFKFEILLYCDKDMLYYYEQLCIDRLFPVYNICKTVKSKLGWKTPDYVKEKIALAQIGRKRKPLSEEHKQKISLALKGKKRFPLSSEWKNNIRNSMIGIKQTKEQIEKRSLANTGKKRTDEMKNKMSLAQKGKIISEEGRYNMSMGAKRRWENWRTHK